MKLYVVKWLQHCLEFLSSLINIEIFNDNHL